MPPFPALFTQITFSLYQAEFARCANRFAQRELSKCQRTSCLSPTLPRFEPGKMKLAAKRDPVKSRPAGMDGRRAAVYFLRPGWFLTSKLRKNFFETARP
jgi:hypothetical protein